MQSLLKSTVEDSAKVVKDLAEKGIKKVTSQLSGTTKKKISEKSEKSPHVYYLASSFEWIKRETYSDIGILVETAHYEQLSEIKKRALKNWSNIENGKYVALFSFKLDPLEQSYELSQLEKTSQILRITLLDKPESPIYFWLKPIT